jgi:hypothetical protein
VKSTIIDLPAKEGLMTPNIDSIIRDHVTLTVRCLDRIYLQGYMPKLQTSGGLCYFLRDHLGHPIPSPALVRPMHDRFVNAIKGYAIEHAVPLIPFESGQDKDAIVATYRAKFTDTDGVVVMGVAQEKARAFKGQKRCGPQGGVTAIGRRQPLLLLPPGRGLGAGVHQDRHVCAVSHQDLFEWARMGETTAASRADPLRESQQRVSQVRQPRASAGDL